MTKLTKQQLATELGVTTTRLIRLENQVTAMREIVSIDKCLSTARELIAKRGNTQSDRELLAAFISEIWWIDVEADQLQEQEEALTPLNKGA